jgi:hypothetical protein
MHVRTEKRREINEGIVPSINKDQEMGDAVQVPAKA